MEFFNFHQYLMIFIALWCLSCNKKHGILQSPGYSMIFIVLCVCVCVCLSYCVWIIPFSTFQNSRKFSSMPVSVFPLPIFSISILNDLSSIIFLIAYAVCIVIKKLRLLQITLILCVFYCLFWWWLGTLLRSYALLYLQLHLLSP